MDTKVIASGSGITFPVADVEPAKELLKTEKTQVAVHTLTGRQIEAACDYTDNCVSGISTNPLVTAAKLAHDQHRPIELSPEAIWTTICQGVGIHIEEHWEALVDAATSGRPFQRQIRVSTEEFPVGSPETPWEDLIADAYQQVLPLVSSDLQAAFQMQFSTSGRHTLAARQICLLSTFNRLFGLYDQFTVCGIPEVTLAGSAADWKLIREGIELFKGLQLEWWLSELRPICHELVAAASGNPNQKFFSEMSTEDPSICGKEKRITGWIGKLFPYICRGLKATVERNNLLEGTGQPPTVIDFPTGLNSVSMESQRGSVVHLVGGLLGISQTASGQLSPKVGWAMHRSNPFESLMKRIKDFSGTSWIERESAARFKPRVFNRELLKLHQLIDGLRISTPDGQLICEFNRFEEVQEIRSMPPLYRIASLGDGRWLAARDDTDIAALLRHTAPPTTVFFVGEGPTDSGECNYVGTDFTSLLTTIFEAAERGSSTVPFSLVPELIRKNVASPKSTSKTPELD